MGRWFDVRAGSQLVGEDDPGYSFFVLVRGQMRVTRARHAARDPRRRASAWPRPRSCAARARKRFSTLTAVTDCAVIEIDPDVLWLASPEVTRKFHLAFLSVMADRLVHAEGALAEMLGTRTSHFSR